MSIEIRVKNWEKWQSYRRDRGQPPWIKIHRCLMRNMEWIQLTDAQRGQLVAIWLLAADHNGVIMAPSENVIQKICFMSSPPDLELFESLGFLEVRRHCDANMAPTRRQHDRPETETETETETEETPPYNPPPTLDANATPTTKTAKRVCENPDEPQEFTLAWMQYPKREGGNPRKRALKAWRARIREGADPQEILDGLDRYRRYCEAKGIVGTSYVMQAATFFGPDRRWQEDWVARAPPNAFAAQGRAAIQAAMAGSRASRIIDIEPEEGKS